jgi:hypothetical protein
MILPPWVKPAACALALSASFGAGWVANGWRWEAMQATALRKQQAAFQKQLDHQNKEAAQYEADREAARVESRERQETIRTIYETVEVPAECAAPDSVRSVLDSAVQSANDAAS